MNTSMPITTRNRRNASHSTGPKSRAGKAVVAQNALRHGVLSLAPVVPTLERAEDWQAHLQATCASLQVVSHLEVVLAERVALLLWRLARVARYEAHALAQSQADVEGEIAQRNAAVAAVSLSPDERCASPHPADIRGDVTVTQSLVDILDCIELLDSATPIPEDQALGLVYAAYVVAVPEQDVVIPVPGVPEQAEEEDVLEWAGRLSWTAGRLRHAVTTYAAYAGTDLTDLLYRLRRDAATAARTAAYKRDRSEAVIQREREDRLLLHDTSLAKILRYEATLERSLTRALDELLRVQALRLRRTSGDEA